MSKCLFSIDVEDWYHILEVPTAPSIGVWSKMPSRVEKNFHFLLNIMDESSVKATCFFLGWIAERYPQLVLEADKRGHEIASHGYSHELAFKMGQRRFEIDVSRSKEFLEQVIGKKVLGYRASGFSYTTASTWLPTSLAKVGLRYDSSLFPTSRGHGGMKGAQKLPFPIQTEYGTIIEVPITVVSLWGKEWCLFGGGYFRLFPFRLIDFMTRQVLDKGNPVIFYIHPREIDPSQPRLAMNPYRKFKTYININGTENKLKRLFRQFKFKRIDEYLATNHRLNLQ